MKQIEIKLERTDVFTRWYCHVCGGCTGKVGVLAEGEDTINGGGVVRVCEQCLEAGDIDARLERRAAHLEACAAEARALIGNLKVPTFAEWEAEIDKCNAKHDIGFGKVGFVPA
jgi:hypothetical protein